MLFQASQVYVCDAAEPLPEHIQMCFMPDVSASIEQGGRGELGPKGVQGTKGEKGEPVSRLPVLPQGQCPPPTPLPRVLGMILPPST